MINSGFFAPIGLMIVTGLIALPAANAFTTDGKFILDANGKAIRPFGASLWWKSPDSPEIAMVKLKAQGLNTIRFAWTNKEWHSGVAQARMDRVAAAALANGIFVVWDNHATNGDSGNCWSANGNGIWYDVGGASDNTDGCGEPGQTSDAQWVQDWAAVAKRYAGNPNILGMDLHNEPSVYSHRKGFSGSTWGDGDVQHDIRLAYERAGNAILAVAPYVLIVAEGVQNPHNNFANLPGIKAPWGDLSTVKLFPVSLNIPNKVVYSIHDYPTHVSGFKPDSGPAKDDMVQQVAGYLMTENIAPLWVGEFAADDLPDGDQAFADGFANYYNSIGAGVCYWMWGYNPSDKSSGLIDAHGEVRPAQMGFLQKLRSQPR
jgi:endoglucanase